jgi:hypothetical protein
MPHDAASLLSADVDARAETENVLRARMLLSFVGGEVAIMLRWQWSFVVFGMAAAACGAGNGPNPPVTPENSIHSSSPDEMPASQPSGLGSPSGHEDAGLPHVAPDGGLQRP